MPGQYYFTWGLNNVSKLRCWILANSGRFLKSPSHLFGISRKQAKPAGMKNFQNRATFGREFQIDENSYSFVRMPFEYLECALNPPRMILAHSGVLALECSSNVVGTQYEYLECCYNPVRIFRMHFECRTSAVRLLPEYRPKSGWKVPPMLYEFTSNAVRTLSEWPPNVVRTSKNSNRMQHEYLECTSNVLRMYQECRRNGPR